MMFLCAHDILDCFFPMFRQKSISAEDRDGKIGQTWEDLFFLLLFF